MSEFQTGGAPAGDPSENATPGAAQNNAATANAQTGGADGGEGGQVTPRTYSEQEMQDRIERATAKAAAKAERRAYREALASLGSQPQTSAPAAQQQHNDGKPTRAQYASDEAYVDALTDWKLEQRDRGAAQERQQQQQRTLTQKTDGIYAEAEKLQGFDREAFDELPLTGTMAAALVDADKPAALMLYLQQNPAEVERISKLTPTRQAAEMGKLEAKATAAPPKTSNAPPPPRTVGSGAGSGSQGNPEDMSMADYEKWREKQRRA